MQEFLLIMRHQDGGKLVSPEQMQVWMQQTTDWINGIAALQKFVSGTGLPFGDIRETIGGFIHVRAESVEEAVEFAKGCPVLQGEGNTVEVRKIA